ncbi:MAG: IS21 family transposase [Muribaculaceae bacterium]|nr:IS21 family transposase [Muribaculaceae bacterium]
MAGKTIKMTDFKQAILLKKQGVSQREIARRLGISRDTVDKSFAFIASKGYKFEALLQLDDMELLKLLHPGHSAITDRKKHEDFLERLDYFREQLRDPHVTRFLLWEEYRKDNPDGYGRAQFYHHLSQNLKVARSEGVFSDLYVPGQLLMTDFAGDTIPIVDPFTGEIWEAQVFVATMAFSDFTFAYAVRSQRSEELVHALGRCFEHLGGVPQMVRLDNLKAGVKKYHPHEPDFNDALRQMGNHYHFVLYACRPSKPGDKALVESAVRRVYNRIYAKLHNRTFHSLEELNEALAQAVLEHNQTRMQRRPYSRQECFIASEKDELQPLPATIFELEYTAQLTVQNNSHIYLSPDKCHYSVHHAYVGRKATVKYTRNIVKIYVGECVFTHLRNHDRFTFFVTDNEHMASNNKAVRDRSVEEYTRRASSVNSDLAGYVDAVFKDGIRQGFAVECRFKTCQGIIATARKYPCNVVSEGCRIALEREKYSSKILGNILEVLYTSDIASR